MGVVWTEMAGVLEELEPVSLSVTRSFSKKWSRNEPPFSALAPLVLLTEMTEAGTISCDQDSPQQALKDVVAMTNPATK